MFRNPIDKLLLVAMVLVQIAFGFWLYGQLRTMSESFGFELPIAIKSLVLCFILQFPLVLSFMFFASVLRVKHRTVWGAFIFLFAPIFFASFGSETWILMDEHRFQDEVSAQKDSPNIYSRARIWPNETASLVYIPGQGIHSTD